MGKRLEKSIILGLMITALGTNVASADSIIFHSDGGVHNYTTITNNLVGEYVNIYAANGSTINVSGNANLTTDYSTLGHQEFGALVQNSGSTINFFGTNNTITTTATGIDGAVSGLVTNQGTINFGGGTINNTATNTTNHNRGVNVQTSGSVININGATNINMVTTGTGSKETEGVFAGSGTVANINANLNVDVKAGTGTIMALGPSSGTVNINNGVTNLTVESATANRIMGVGMGEGSTVLNTAAGTTLNINMNGTPTTQYGILGQGGSTITANGAVNIHLNGTAVNNGNNNIGVYSNRNSTQIFNGDVSIDSVNQSIGIRMAGGTSEYNGNLTVYGTNNDMAVGSTAGSVRINKNQNKTVKLDGRVSSLSNGTGITEIHLSDSASYIHGDIINSNSAGLTHHEQELPYPL